MTAESEAPIGGPTTGAEDLPRRLAEAFRAGGEELYVVGGAVRDAMLGERDIDLDFATSARPDKTADILTYLGIGSVYRVGEKFGTIGLAREDALIEITTYRAEEIYSPGSRKPEVRFGRTLLEDLSRRDFTINAMAQDPLTGELVDPLGGREDLRGGLIRAVGNPAARFHEDPLRLLRAVRFAARLGFAIETETWRALVAGASQLTMISRERIRDEYTRMLGGTAPTEALTLLRDGGLMRYSAPMLLELTTMPDHGPFHPLSLWDHVMQVVAGVEPYPILRWAALLHDIAKPRTRTYEPNGRPRFFHHEEVGAEMARELLTSLRYSNEIVDGVALLVETHMQLHSYTPEWSDGAIRRLMLRLRPLLPQALALARADAAGHSLTGEAENAPKFDELERRIDDLSREQEARIASPLTGDDLMQRFGRPPGAWIKAVKNAICDALLDGRLDPGDRTGAWRIAEETVRNER